MTLSVAISPELDHDATLRALRRCVGRRIRKLLEIVLVSSVPDIHFGLERFLTFRTVFPIAVVLLVKMEGTESIAAVVSVTTIMRIREQHILVFVIADPGTAAVCLCQFTGFPTQAATTRG